jgi:isoleucyl-tRNA synthetase
MQQYTATFVYNHEGDPHKVSRFFDFKDNLDHRDEIRDMLKHEFENDLGFKIVSLYSGANNSIDYELIDRMRETRDICELGHKVRAEAKIKNRQPLHNAYVLFSNDDTRNWMVNIDCGKNEYRDIIADELNVDRVVFINGKDKFVDINIKPNFRVLGPKGLGKQAQVLKNDLNSIGIEEKNILYRQMELGETVNVSGVDLKLEDIEIEYKAKPGFASASSKHGMVVLDTTLDKDLVDRCFVAEFRSVIQGLRKETGLQLTDKISLDMLGSSETMDILWKKKSELMKALLMTDMRCLATEPDLTKAHKLDVNGSTVYVYLYKELGT